MDKHPSYRTALPQWQLVEDACAGQSAIKAGKEKYLPKPNPQDDTKAADIRYDQYLLRAVYYNACFRTLMGMVGVAFRKKPRSTIPAAIDYVEWSVDGAGLSIDQQSQWTLAEVIKKGRCGLMVDYPSVDGDTSRADVERGIRASIKAFAPETIVDWNEEETDTGMRLNYVKLAYMSSVLDIQTGIREDKENIIALLLVDGVYEIRYYDDSGDMSNYTAVQPRDASGNTLSEIPFIFTGSENNNPDIDQALLYDLAEINVAHYRNSADNEEASFITGQPTLAVTSSLSPTVWKEQNPNGVMIGSRKGHFLGESGDIKLVQADPNNLPRENMKDKEAQMIALGAQLVAPSNQETAFTTGVNLATNTSSLALAVGNVSDAYTKCLEWVMQFQTTVEDEIKYSINTEFFPTNVDAQTLTAWVSAVQGGIVPASIVYDLLRDANLTALTNEEIEEEIENSGTGLDLG
jgi:hypothetical protein